jgi:hypothetical protein
VVFSVPPGLCGREYVCKYYLLHSVSLEKHPVVTYVALDLYCIVLYCIVIFVLLN